MRPSRQMIDAIESFWAVCVALGALRIPANEAQLSNLAGNPTTVSLPEIVRILNNFPVKARFVSANLERLAKLSMPAIAILNSGHLLVIGRVTADGIVCQAREDAAPVVMNQLQFASLWSGTLLLIGPRLKLSIQIHHPGLFWFFGVAAKYRYIFGEAAIASFFLQTFALVTPLISQVVIDKVLVHRGLSTLEVMVFGLVLISIFDVVLNALRSYLLMHTSNRIDTELGSQLFRHLVALPLQYFQERKIGDVTSKMRELDVIRQFMTGAAMSLWLDTIFGLVFMLCLFFYSVTLALVVVATIPIYAAIASIVTPIFRAKLDEKYRTAAECQGLLVETVAGIETVKSIAAEPILQRRWEDRIAAHTTSSFRAQITGIIGNLSATAVSKIANAAILLLGAQLVIQNKMTVGELVAFNMLSAQITGPVLRLTQMWQDFQQARMAAERLADVLRTAPERRATASTDSGTFRGEIMLEKISFRYKADLQPVLNEFSLSIPSGQVIGIVGPSGSGKSTLTKIIQRLYLPERGRILIDGRDTSTLDVVWMRRQIGVVLQESVLFNMTVRENIALAHPGMSFERVKHAAHLAGADEFIERLPEGYDTVLEERGSSLSGGQRQRIAIARALLSDPRILIFDEATSALDYESESIIQANMRKIASTRTVIIIAHRLSTVRQADRIITMERGRIVEDGTHQELLERKGRYAQLHQIQIVGGRNDGI